MSTGDRQEDWQAGSNDDQSGFKHKLTARQDTSRRLPQSEDVTETTVTVLDGHPVTSSRPPSDAARPPLPSVAPPTSSDDVWSTVPPVSDKDRSSVKSDDSRPPSVASIPARLPALDVRQSSKDDLKTNVETDKPKAADEFGSVESIKMEVGAQSGRLASAGGAGAWTTEKADDNAVDDTTEITVDAVPDDAAKDDAEEELRQPEPQDDVASMKHDDDVPASTSDPHDDEIITPSEVAEADPDDTAVSHTRSDEVDIPENVQTFEDAPAVDDQSPDEMELQPENTEVQTPDEQTNTPGENDSGVNVEDVRNDEPITAEQELSNDIIEQPSETQPADTTLSNKNLLQVAPPGGDSTPLSARKHHAAHGDRNRLLSPRRSLIPPDSGSRRNSFLDVRDSKQLRASDENLHNVDPNKPRLLALAQKGEWSVLDQLLRAMERSSFHEVNLADEV